MFVGSNCKNTPFCRNLKMFLFKICRNLKMFLLYLCSFLIILGYDCTSPRTLTLSRVRIPSLRMFQSWFVVSDLQCFCPPCSNRRAFAFGKRQPRGVASPLPLSERCLNLKKVDTLWLQKYKIILMCTKKSAVSLESCTKKSARRISVSLCVAKKTLRRKVAAFLLWKFP